VRYFFAALLLAACGEQRIETELPADPALLKVSTTVALMETRNRLAQEVSCLAHQSAGTERHKARCELFTRIAEATAPVFSDIKSAGRLPPELYVFSLSRALDGGHAESLVGFFTRSESCETLEALAREREFATSPCRRIHVTR
jgi:hypothetical protein